MTILYEGYKYYKLSIIYQLRNIHSMGRVYKHHRRFLVRYVTTILLLISIITAGSWMLWRLPQLRVSSEKSFTPKERIELENTTRTSLSQAFGTLSQTVGGIVLIIGLYFTWRNLIATEDRQITERFTKAIEQFGSDKAEVCIGGIYALERIANDSERDHWVIMEVLTCFIKNRYSLENNRGNQKIIPREIQAALTVIKRRDIAKDPKQKVLDLSFTYLKGADLRGESFKTIIIGKESFTMSNLRGINFTGANLEDSDFTGANLIDTCFVKANLNSCEFVRANLSKADFTEASTVGCIFTDANLCKTKGLKS
ncbi:MAG: pentapeptide repeat-containing protein [Nostoc sp. DedQUE04]|uniref:pentapeptide repeat-containing protein n=1 Tax=Nostoc sp. DedQUE04 TaxID=3075390 RepID=UPI002AD28E22|nr:pentapeptide repeat-containing protein [Nostoc sp. DedQUE04]MDZ8136766.1 pentapeptide repeat-containing protein [Nostoc sp. DedQUE04]